MPTKVYYVNKRTTKPSKGFKNDNPSLTVKDDAYTIQQLLKRAQGGIIPEQRKPNYLDVDDLNKISPLFNFGNVDLTDLQALQADILATSERINEAIDQVNASKEEQKNDPSPPVEEPKEE